MTEDVPSRFPVPLPQPGSPWLAQHLARKSRFLAQVCQCRSRDEGREFWQTIQALHPDATHNCWAFVAGPPGDNACVGYSDDGEPRGTAGRPMLNVLLHCGIGQICVVVSRWFGGIKLGAGGLAHAYQDAVLAGLAELPLASSVNLACLRLSVDYATLPAVRRLLAGFEAVAEKCDYGETVELVIKLPVDRQRELEAAVATATNGRVKPEPLS